MPELSVVIPVYNSRRWLEPSVRRLAGFLDRAPWDYEILLRDDASTDGSRDAFPALAAACPRVRYSGGITNQGLGATLRVLFTEARGETVIYCDADLPFGVEVIAALPEWTRHYDVVVVSRYLSSRRPSVGPLRWLSSRVYYALCRLLFRVPVRDIGSGTVAFSRKALERLALNADGFDIHIELLAQSAKHKLPVAEIPGVYQDSGPGTFSMLRHGPRVVKDTLRLWRRLNREQKGKGVDG